MTSQTTDRPAYGYDAPGVMLGLLAGGALALLASVGGWALLPGLWQIAAAALGLAGLVPFLLGTLMLVYAVHGKARTREHILSLAGLAGSETLLDVGTGAGLLLTGAARRLPQGHATGIDLWSAKDLSANAPETTARNAALEGVSDRVTILTADARALPFSDASFDRAVSLLCLHNIEPKADQTRACHEIARILKPGGRAVIGDYVPTHAYATALAEAGLTIHQSRPAFGVARSLLWVLVAEKPPAAGA